jgi:Ca2+-binding RTX toxin-like protein
MKTRTCRQHRMLAVPPETYLGRRLGHLALGVALLVGVLVGVLPARSEAAGAIVDPPGCRALSLAKNDDGSSGEEPLGFTLDFYGVEYDSLWVNNNGNVTFDDSMSTYTPFDVVATTRVLIAPFFADVDTRPPESGPVTYGATTYLGRNAFCVNWINVGYYSYHVDKLNSFQLLLVERADVGAGDFDIIFNYDQIDWETGDASGGIGGLGGTPARVGYAGGTDTPGSTYEVPGSGVAGALLDSNPETGLSGSYVMPVRSGNPEPITYYCAGVEATIVGTAGNDILTGTTGRDVIVGLGGDDVINGLGGNDLICGGPGNDTIKGSGGRDRLYGDDTLDGGGGDDTLWGGAGNDLLIPGLGADKVNGGPGVDTVTYKSAPAAVIVDLVAKTVTGGDTDTLATVENVDGSAFADVIRGNALANWLRGLGGNDTLEGRGGNDRLEGGSGIDSVDGGPGTDTCVAETESYCEL